MINTSSYFTYLLYGVSMEDKDKLISEKGWDSWGNYVLKTLEKVEEKVDTLEDKINSNNLSARTDLVELKTKAGIIAAISAIIASGVTSLIVGLLIYYLSHKPVNVEPVKPTKAYIEYVITSKSV